MFRVFVLSISLILLVIQSPASACCVVFSFWQLKDTTFIGGDDPSIAFTVFKYTNEFALEENCKDTIHQSEMIADLKQSYDSSAAVVVAFISRANKFVLEPDSNGEYFYAESVTVKIEKVIKGASDKTERIFISPLDDGSFRYAYDNETGNTDSIYSPITSLYDHGYKAIEGMRFLLFLNKKESSDSNLTIQKSDPCDFSSDKYIVDNSNKVHFDGLEIEPMTNKIKKVSLLTVDLDTIIHAFSNTTSGKLEQRAIKQVRSSKYKVYCDLMGKRVPANISGRHTTASQLIISVDEGRKNSAKMTLR